MAHQLPVLRYPYNALEPHIDEATVRLHHDKHHATYVNNLNAALEGHPELQAKSLEDLLRHLDQVPEAIRTAVKNNGGQHQAHSLYFDAIAPGGPLAPVGALAAAIDKAFGSFAGFQERFAKAGTAHFGSGWAWLVVKPSGDLAVYSTANGDNPLSQGDTPILVMDIWEHAYYLKYQNRRADYIAAFWHLINWAEVAERYAKAL